MDASEETRRADGLSAALELSPEEWPAFLREFCGDDVAMRRELESLLGCYREEALDTCLLSLESVRTLFTDGLAQGMRIGNYEVVEELGRGGMSVVYLAKRADGEFDLQVAIKVLDGIHSFPSDEARFGRERRLLAQLHDPSIAKILDAGRHDGFAYFVMEYVEGRHIDRYCEEERLSIGERLRLFLRVCEGVSAAHNSGIVHRDLKPANVLVDTTGAPKLIDFGIAKRLDTGTAEEVTLRGMEPLTLLYASPERLAGKMDEADLASVDIYSLGVMLYELLTGHRPIEPDPGAAIYEQLRMLIENEPVAPSRYDKRLAGDVEFLVMKALRKERAERYRSVEEMAGYIRLYLDNQPLPEVSGALGYKARKFVRRNRVPLMVAATIVAVLLGGIVATLYQARIAARRFNDVRQLATSFLFEFDAAIADLAGSTRARELVVAKGLEYLDKLAAEAGGDESLQAEIAGAYERLAGVQGNAHGFNLGEYAKAAASYEKALQIRQKLADARPQDRTRRRELGMAYVQLADGWFMRGSTSTGIGHYRKGMEILEGLSRAGDQSLAVQGGIQRVQIRLCNFLLSEGDQKGAIANCRAAVAAAEVLYSQKLGDPGRRAARAAAWGLTANALRVDGQYDEALRMITFTLGELRALRELEPANANHLRNLAGTLTYLGLIQVARKAPVAAATAFAESVQLMREMLRPEGDNVRAKTTLAVTLVRYAGVLHKANRQADALAAGTEGLQIFKAFADQPKALPDDWNNYASYALEIAVPELRNPTAALAYSQRAVAAAGEKPSLVLLSTLVDAYTAVGKGKEALDAAHRAMALYPEQGDKATAGLLALLRTKVEALEKQAAKAR